ncbi:hypothetical protein STEG23_036728, partial [Scotinomys teguina]
MNTWGRVRGYWVERMEREEKPERGRHKLAFSLHVNHQKGNGPGDGTEVGVSGNHLDFLVIIAPGSQGFQKSNLSVPETRRSSKESAHLPKRQVQQKVESLTTQLQQVTTERNDLRDGLISVTDGFLDN